MTFDFIDLGDIMDFFIDSLAFFVYNGKHDYHILRGGIR
jgi:hypothetical protein